MKTQGKAGQTKKQTKIQARFKIRKPLGFERGVTSAYRKLVVGLDSSHLISFHVLSLISHPVSSDPFSCHLALQAILLQHISNAFCNRWIAKHCKTPYIETAHRHASKAILLQHFSCVLQVLDCETLRNTIETRPRRTSQAILLQHSNQNRKRRVDIPATVLKRPLITMCFSNSKLPNRAELRQQRSSKNSRKRPSQCRSDSSSPFLDTFSMEKPGVWCTSYPQEMHFVRDFLQKWKLKLWKRSSGARPSWFHLSLFQLMSFQLLN